MRKESKTSEGERRKQDVAAVFHHGPSFFNTLGSAGTVRARKIPVLPNAARHFAKSGQVAQNHEGMTEEGHLSRSRVPIPRRGLAGQFFASPNFYHLSLELDKPRGLLHYDHKCGILIIEGV